MEVGQAWSLAGDNTENRCFVDTVFAAVLLPATRTQVVQQLFQKYGDALDTVEAAQLLESGDFSYIMRAGRFDVKQQNLAFKLKQNRDLLAREEIIPDSVKTAVYEDVKALLETFPNTNLDLEKLERAWAYGARSFLKPTKVDQEKDREIECMRKHIENLEHKLKSFKWDEPQEIEELQSEASSCEPNGEDFYFSDDDEEDSHEAVVARGPLGQSFSLFSSSFGLDLGAGRSFGSLALQQQQQQQHQQQQQQEQKKQQENEQKKQTHQERLESVLICEVQRLVVGDDGLTRSVLRALLSLPPAALGSLIQDPRALAAKVRDIVRIIDSKKQASSLQYVDNSTPKPTTRSKPNYKPAEDIEFTFEDEGRSTFESPAPAPKASAPAPAPVSYRAAAARSPSSTPSPTGFTVVQKKEKKAPAEKSAGPYTAPNPANTATEVGYKLNYKAPRPDPRFRGDVQIMMGPIPGSLSHETAYLELRSIFQAKGRVQFMYMSPSFVPKELGKAVKYGYVVFEDKSDATRLLKEQYVTLMKQHKIRLTKMVK